LARKKQVDDRLMSLIKDDTKLTHEVKMEYITLSRYFVSEFKSNIMLTSIELDEKYGFGIDVWKDFLANPVVKRYVDTFVKEIISKNTDNALSTGVGVRDAIGVKKELDRYSDANTNENFVVFMMPQKEEEVYVYDSEVA
jgi:hypothetical protein